MAYWLTTLPDGLDVSPATHAMFPIVLVKACLGEVLEEDAANVLAGGMGRLNPLDYSGGEELEITVPDGSKYRVGRNEKGVFEYEMKAPGMYVWKTAGDGKTVGLTRAAFAAGESELAYCGEKEAMGDVEGVVARSYEDLLEKAEKLDEPEPRWTVPIVVAMGLLCLEALIAAWSSKG